MRDAPTLVTPGTCLNRSTSASTAWMPSASVARPPTRVSISTVSTPRRVDAGIDGGGFLQRTQKQSGGDEEQERDRHLRRDQRLPEPCAPAIGAGIRAAQRGRDVDAGGLQRGQERGCDRGDRGQQPGDELHARVDAELERERDRQARVDNWRGIRRGETSTER